LNTDRSPNRRTVTRVRRLAGRVTGRAGLERRIGDQTRWLYAAWAVQLAATVAVLLRLFLR